MDCSELVIVEYTGRVSELLGEKARKNRAEDRGMIKFPCFLFIDSPVGN